MHEAVGSEQAMRLPEYQGSLPVPVIDDDPYVSPRSFALGLRRLDAKPHPVPKPVLDYGPLVNGMRLVAASILVVAIGTFAWGLLMSARNHGIALAPNRPAPRIGGSAAESQPDERGLRTLALLKLRSACFAPGRRLLAAADAGTPLIEALSANELLTCCTDCHAAGKAAASMKIAASDRFQQSCAACHRG
jgi:hypothetical protein